MAISFKQPCIENAKYLSDPLNKIGYPKVSLFPNQIIVTFEKPRHEIIQKYQLATQRDIAHVVVMQHIIKSCIDAFCQALQDSY